MPKIHTALTVFVASPSDVVEERDIIADEVAELNRVWGRKSGLRLEILRWEKDTYPSFSSDPQAVVNDQIGDDYDIFLGILWTRFGTQTPRYESGTIEEFHRAYDRHSKGEKIMISMYFKDAPFVPSKIDPCQLKQVHQFRDGIPAKGGLFKTFTDSNEFRQQVRVQLSSILLDFSQQDGATIHPVHTSSTRDEDEEDALGFIDYLEISNEEMNKGAQAAGKISSDIKECAEVIGSVTCKIHLAVEQKSLPSLTKELDRAADAFSRLTINLRRNKTDMKEYFDQGVMAFEKVLNLSSDFEPISHEVKTGILEDLEGLKFAMNAASEAIFQYTSVVENMSGVNRKIKRVKRELLEVLEDLLSDFLVMQGMWDEMLIATRKLPTSKSG